MWIVIPDDSDQQLIVSFRVALSVFLIGGANPTSLIKELKEINGISIADLEKSMRPNELSKAGFLGSWVAITDDHLRISIGISIGILHDVCGHGDFYDGIV